MWRTPLRLLSSRRARQALTVPNVLATIAVCLAMGGTAYAAVSINSKHVRNSSLTGADIRNNSLKSIDFKKRSLAASNFSAKAVKKVKVIGEPGADGPQGPPGATGRQGATGDAGEPAPRAFTFQTAKQSNRIKGADMNPASNDNLPDCEDVELAGDTMVGCTGGAGTPIRYPRWNYWCGPGAKHCNVTETSVPQLTRSMQTLIVTSENASGGLLNMPYAGTIVLNGSLTFYTKRSAINQRIECQLQIRRVAGGNQGEPINVGVPIVVARRVSSDLNEQERLVNLPLTGAIAQSAGTFETQVACRAPDDDGDQANRIEYIEGNLSVLSTRTNGHA